MEAVLLRVDEGLLLRDRRQAAGRQDISDFVYRFAREFCIEGYAYRAGDAVNFAIGQGDTIVTPLQLARAYAALSNGGTLYAPRVGKAIVDVDGDVVRRIPPKKVGTVGVPGAHHRLHRHRAAGRRPPGHDGLEAGGLPARPGAVRAKTGSAEVYGKQTTGWVASYTDDYVVVMMISQAGTGSGSTGDGIRAIWESLYGIDGETVDPAEGGDPRRRRPRAAADLPTRRLDPAARPARSDR